MPKQYNIRWTENDRRELQRSVKNFNAKVSRLEKKYEGRTDVVIPERVKVKDLRELIGTRRDLQVELRSLQAFSRKGSEELVRADTNDTIYLTKWQKKELIKRSKPINEERARRREELENKELIHKGTELGYTKGALGMGKTDTIMLRPTQPFTKSMTKADINKKLEHYRRESQSTYWKKRDLIMRESFIKALENNFNPSQVRKIIQNINRMDIEEFKNRLLSDPQDFDLAYTRSEDEAEATLEHLSEMFYLEPEKKPKPKKKKKKPKKKKPKKKKTKKGSG